MKVRGYCRAGAAFLLLAGASAPAHALFGDRLEVFVSETVTHDSNLFRITGERPTNQVLGGGQSKSDTSFNTTFGLNLNYPVSRQRLLAGFAVTDVRYSENSVLNFTGYEGRAAWQWVAASNLSGEVGITESESIATFVNTQTPIRNLVNARQVYGNAALMVSPYWRLRGVVDQTRVQNSEVTRLIHDIEVDGAEASVSYISRAGNSIGVAYRRDEAKYPNRFVLAGAVLDNAWTQNTVNLLLDWQVTPQSRVSGRVGKTERQFGQLQQRDFDGVIYRAIYDWRPRERFSLSAIVQRDISAYEDITTSLVLLNGVALRPSYSLTEKTRLTGNIEYVERQYRGDPNVAVGAATERNDKVWTLGVSVAWQALRNLSVTGSVLHERRTSNQVFSDYEATIFSVRGRLSF
jgi:exopolysaccharide biosynthesis operon protein EpsL